MLRKERYVKNNLEVKIPVCFNFGNFILDRLREQPTEKIALINGKDDSKMTYGELAQYAVDLAVSLMELGIQTGDVIAICLRKCNEYVPIMIGILLTGATYTILELDTGRAHLTYKLDLTKPKLLIYCQSFWKKYGKDLATYKFKTCISFDDNNAETEISIKSLTTRNVNIERFNPAKVDMKTDIAMIVFSSGSTGYPKGIMTPHYACLYSCSINDFQDLNTSSCLGKWRSRYDTHMLFKFLAAGKTVTYFCEGIDILFKCIQDHKVNIAFLYPYIIGELVNHVDLNRHHLNSLQYIYSCGSPIDPELKRMAIKSLPSLKTLVVGYGMTEMFELTSERWGVPGLKPSSIGKAAPGVTLKVIDMSTGAALGPYQRGEIYCKALTEFKGYIGIDPSTYLDKEGFLKTGDIGYYDEDEYFYIIGRIKEIINYIGCKTSPEEIERILLQHPGVKDVGVVGKPMPVFTELPTAFVVRKPGHDITEKELMDFVANDVPDYMKLRGGVHFVPEIPRNSAGKIMRRDLKQMLNALT